MVDADLADDGGNDPGDDTDPVDVLVLLGVLHAPLLRDHHGRDGRQENRQSLDDGQKVLHSADSREDGGEGGHDDGKPGVLDLTFELRVNEDVLQGEGRGIDVVVLRRPDTEDGADEHQDAEAESAVMAPTSSIMARPTYTAMGAARETCLPFFA